MRTRPATLAACLPAAAMLLASIAFAGGDTSADDQSGGIGQKIAKVYKIADSEGGRQGLRLLQPAEPSVRKIVIRGGGGSFLGIGVADIDEDRGKELGLKETYGVEVKSVVEDSA